MHSSKQLGDNVKIWGDGSKVINTLIYGRGDRVTTPAPWAELVIDQVERPNSHFEIINCTIDDSVGQVLYSQLAGYDTIPITIVLKNNIFSTRCSDCYIDLGHAVNLIAENNLFYFPKSDVIIHHGDIEYTRQNIQDLGPGNIYGNPLFIHPTMGGIGDYHLRPGSPAIDAGTSDGAPPIDLEGNPRPQGNGVDIGCYEQ